MNGIQSALEPAGVHADRIGTLWDVFLVVSTVVYVLVLLFTVVALRRRSQNERGVRTGVTIAIGLTVVTLFGLLVSSVLTGRATASTQSAPIEITLTGRQWWWQFDYDHPDVHKRFTTANELTIPVGIPVKIWLRSPDVIHSFWIPNLNGKQDLIPGKDNQIVLQATRTGVFRGQCAEFCGLQHARMAFWVNAVAPGDYVKWVESQRQPSKIPSTPEQRKGQETFMSSPCPLCHTIQGTPANGKTAPDLTHFASRRSIAAATLPNRRGFLAGWILDPQHIKPGAFMPPTQLEQGELEPLLAYLESLQ
jgi:cytochrome c oxidase subunit II